MSENQFDYGKKKELYAETFADLNKLLEELDSIQGLSYSEKEIDEHVKKLLQKLRGIEDKNIIDVHMKQILEELIQALKTIGRNSTTRLQVKKMAQTMKSALSRIDARQPFSASIKLPPRNTMEVRLVPVTMLDRLEEYRSDENLSYLLMGVFSGAILGVLTNWTTDSPSSVTEFSVLFLFFLIVLMIFSSTWAYRLAKRVRRVKDEMFLRKKYLPSKKLNRVVMTNSKASGKGMPL